MYFRDSSNLYAAVDFRLKRFKQSVQLNESRSTLSNRARNNPEISHQTLLYAFAIFCVKILNGHHTKSEVYFANSTSSFCMFKYLSFAVLLQLVSLRLLKHC